MDKLVAKREYMRSYYKKNRQVLLKKKQDFYLANLEEITLRKKKYYNENSAKVIACNLAYINKRSKVDYEYRLSRNLRSRLNLAIRNNYIGGKAVRELGCSVKEFKQYLESKFQPGMMWENYGPKGWHIDHIKPLASFDLTKEEEIKVACNYINLQPMWAKDNLSKGSNAL